MSEFRTFAAAAAFLAVAAPLVAQSRVAATSQPTAYTIDQFLSPASPLEVSAAKKADRKDRWSAGK